MSTEPWDKIGGYQLFDTRSHILHAFSHFSVCCILSTLEVGIPTASYITSFTFSSKKKEKRYIPISGHDCDLNWFFFSLNMELYSIIMC